MRIFAILFVCLLLMGCAKGQDVPPVAGKAADGEAREAQYKKEMDEIKKSLKGDIKVKLKRDGKGAYTWEITGKETQEILKANEALRKRLAETQ
jgi:hypothetical protein